MENYATIDVGSNQVLIHIAAIENKKVKKVLFDRGEITKLGEGVNQTGILKDEAMNRTLSALKGFKELMDKFEVKSYAAVGTSALREAKNSDIFVKRVKDEIGIEIEVIPGEEEARLSYIAVVGGLNLGDRETAVIDIGGGSTEFIFGKGTEILNKLSLKIGALKMTERFLKSDPVKDEEFNQLMDYLNNRFREEVNSPFNNPFLVGMGGTMSNLGAMKHKLETYNPEIVHGSSITIEELKEMIDDLKTKTIEERKKIKGLQPKRAEVILAGMGILLSIMNRLGSNKITVSDMGLRHGLMFERFCS